jgi:hypothetical protein
VEAVSINHPFDPMTPAYCHGQENDLVVLSITRCSLSVKDAHSNYPWDRVFPETTENLFPILPHSARQKTGHNWFFNPQLKNFLFIPAGTM